MDNKLSELSKPVAWPNGCNETAVEALRYLADKPRPSYGNSPFNAEHLYMIASEIKRMADQPLYSQEYVSALLADNEAKDKRIAELEGKLATPVRLLGEMLVHDWEHRVERQAAFKHRKIAWDARLEEDKKAILVAGFTFTVEGDEQ